MKLSRSRIVVYLSAVALAAGLGLGTRFLWESPKHASMAEGTPGPSGVSVGGPFALVDHTGRTVGEADFRGRLMLVYFGFTRCPDACPTTLTAIADALDLLGDAAREVVPVFVTVDPERDTPEYLARYVRNFHPSLVGLTGTPEQVAAAAKAYRVYYAKVRDQGAAEGDYVMDHTSILYLMDRDGRFRFHFTGHGAAPAAIATRLRELL